jgi:hypothetical protein
MAWDEIHMDEKTWWKVRREAIKKGYPHVRARRTPGDLLTPCRYLFISGAPQKVIWKIIGRKKK